jgi:hypothetical protein
VAFSPDSVFGNIIFFQEEEEDDDDDDVELRTDFLAI